jgi:hypothetical protein
VAARSKELDCGRRLAGNTGSNPVGGMVVCCQVDASASGMPLVQRGPAVCGVSE